MKLIFILLLLFSVHAFAQTKAVPSYTVTGTTVTLDASKSTGSIGSFYWTATPAVAFTNGLFYGGSTLANITATIKPATKYVFTLTVQDKGGSTVTGAVTYDPTVIVVPVKKKVAVIGIYNADGTLFTNVTVYSDTTLTHTQ